MKEENKMDGAKKGGWVYVNQAQDKKGSTGGRYSYDKQPGRTAAIEARIIKCEGYKAVRGAMLVTVHLPYGKVTDMISGDWLYKPDTDCWYCRGTSYPAEICKPWHIE